MEEGEKGQFDILLGGSERLPVKMSIMKFATARAQEIAALTEAIEDPQRKALVFQRLPKIMRRRVMSHNAKRMPRRLREAHLKQLQKSGLPPKSKRPSRKYRRRPRNLLLEYNRRKKRFVWLETHIWHAKRFHMTEKWGYKVANFPNDKTYRACYRASANHCLLQDISYYCCIELCGPQEALLARLSLLTHQDCGLTFAARAFLAGSREGRATVFRRGAYPLGAIGSVTFLWKPQRHEAENRTLWIWIHPSMYTDFLNELIETFGFVPTLSESNDNSDNNIFEEEVISPVKKKAKLDVSVTNTEKVQVTAPSVNYEDSTGKVSMVLLKDTLNRFRLTGPHSQAILADALNVTAIPGDKKAREQAGDDIEEIFSTVQQQKVITLKSSSDEDMEVTVLDESSDKLWWETFYSDSKNREAWQAQRVLWSELKNIVSPAQLSPHQVLAITVIDPRYQMPACRKKVVPEVGGECSFTQPVPSACCSPLWSSKVRTAVTMSKTSTAEFNKQRGQNLVPGFMKEEFVEEEGVSICPTSKDTPQPARIPLLFIQRPGSQDPVTKRLGFDSGWDIILPAGWAMPLWLALVFRGARVGGLKETLNLMFETGGDMFPPDTAACEREAQVKRDELADKHFRLPPAKRPNYQKLGSVSPFKCCWDLLVHDWYGDPSFFLLRDRSKLDTLRRSLDSCQIEVKNKKRFRRPQKTVAIPRINFQVNTQRCLVPVKVTLTRRGTPSDFAMICLPSADDMQIYKENLQHEGPVEPIHEDKYSKARKESLLRHQKLLRRLRRKRIKAKKTLLEKQETPVIIKKRKGEDPPTKELVEKHAEKMRTLWLPEPETIKDTSSKPIMGFVTKGDFSLTEACGVGIGYVVLKGLMWLLESGSPLVLVRNPSSQKYHFAVLQVR